MRPSIRRSVGAVVAAAFAAGAVALVAAPWPQHRAEPVVIAAVPHADRTVLSCTGPLLVLGADPSDAEALAVVADQRVVGRTADGAETPVVALAAPDAPGSAPLAVVVEPDEAGRVEAAAAGSARADRDDLRGLAASACTRPAAETWLMGGSTDVGAADLVLLANPGDVAARADITVYGADGPVSPATGAGIIVPPGTQRAVPLAALALGQTQPVLRVAASEALLQVALQSSITRTLVPGGVDVGAAVAAPAQSLVIPAVSIAAADSGEATASVRLLAPSEATTATVALVPLGVGDALSFEIALEAGRPAVLALPDVPAGAYTVRVEAGAPVVAAAWHATGVGGGGDFAWSVPALPLAGPTLVAIAEGPSPRLVLAAGPTGDGSQGGPRTVTVTSSAGASQQVAVAPGGAALVPVTEGEVYAIEPDGAGVHAAVAFVAPDAIAGYPVAPSAQAAAEVDVTVR